MDWDAICRVCLQTNKEIVSLFDCDENNESLNDKYKECCGIEVTDNDALPTLICVSCVDKLVLSHNFRRECIESVRTLNECLQEYKFSTGKDIAQKGVKKELITIKQENGVFLQYELPIEDEEQSIIKKSSPSNVFKRRRGRPRKNEKKNGSKGNASKALDSLSYNTDDIKVEPDIDIDEDRLGTDFDGDSDFEPKKEVKSKRAKPHKERKQEDDILLQETLLAGAEPIVLVSGKRGTRGSRGARGSSGRPRKETSNVCDTCGASFRYNATLLTHIRRHFGIKPFSCSICGYSCVLKMELRRHMFRHTGIKPYKCRICDRAYSDFGSRQKHERLHTGERPYQCTLCNKNFTYSYVLNNHMLTHTGEKRYSCEPCNKKFTKAHHLKYHNKVHHRDLYLKLEMEAKEKRMSMARQQIKISNINDMDVLNQQLELLTQHDMASSDGVVYLTSEGKEDNQESEQNNMVMLGGDTDINIDIERVTDANGETRLVCQIPSDYIKHQTGHVIIGDHNEADSQEV